MRVGDLNQTTLSRDVDNRLWSMLTPVTPIMRTIQLNLSCTMVQIEYRRIPLTTSTVLGVLDWRACVSWIYADWLRPLTRCKFCLNSCPTGERTGNRHTEAMRERF